jgi:hypothetical protein
MSATQVTVMITAACVLSKSSQREFLSIEEETGRGTVASVNDRVFIPWTWLGKGSDFHMEKFSAKTTGTCMRQGVKQFP